MVNCFGCFSHWCDKMPDKRNLRKEGFIWVHNLRVQPIVMEPGAADDVTSAGESR